jgi:hypothetical protein
MGVVMDAGRADPGPADIVPLARLHLISAKCGRDLKTIKGIQK